MPTPTPQPATPLWLQPAFIISLLMLPLVYMVSLIILWPYTGNTYSNEIKIMVISAVLSNGILTAILGYWLMTSASSEKKTDAIISGQLQSHQTPAASSVTTTTGDISKVTTTTPGDTKP